MRLIFRPRIGKKPAIAATIIFVALLVVGLLLTEKTINPQMPSNDIKVVLPEPLKDFDDFGLKIDKIKVNVPIIPDVDGFDESIYYNALLKGVGQFKGSQNPDQNGNLFIFGHSSYAGSGQGDYKEVFKQLNNLTQGDEIEVWHKKKLYIYKVSDSYQADIKDWSLLDPTPEKDNDKTLTLMTCWPLGETSSRWGVVARQAE